MELIEKLYFDVEEKMMKLSIIIPVYNAENDIGRCVESIKTINEIDYECIIIDDGSTDNTWLKLKKYTENIPQFIIKHLSLIHI